MIRPRSKTTKSAPRRRLPPVQTYEVLKRCKHHPADAVLLIEKKKLWIHKSILVILSPIFQVIISKIEEKKLPALISVDFSYKTVKNVIDYCLGHDLGEKKPAEIVAMLHFAATYNFQIGIDKLEQALKSSMSPAIIPRVAEYAWTHNRDEFKYECGKIFFDHRNEISDDPQFTNLDPVIALGIIKMAQIYGQTKKQWLEEANKTNNDWFFAIFKVVLLLSFVCLTVYVYEVCREWFY
uniref:BTB domain-containing protein n=1 Tax=Panagrellus redivivus TaxID=6233 RepID=A0A7E4UPQ8_PANRE